MEQKYKIIDNSGDKKYFSQIPHIIVNHSTAYEQSLYLIMKRTAGEEGTCYKSINTLAQKMGVHKTTVSKTITKLLKRKWIEEIEGRKIKGGTVRQFIITDIWPQNIKEYENDGSGAQMTSNESGAQNNESGAVVDESGAQTGTKNNTEEEHKEEHLGLDKPTWVKRKSIFFPKEWFDKVIASYEELKGIKPQGQEYLPIQQAVKSMFMSKRSAEDIIACMVWFKDKAASGDKKYVWTENWTIQTIRMKIAEFLAGKYKDKESIPPEYAKFWK